LLVDWTRNSEDDVNRYKIHYGTTPAYGQTMEVFGPPIQLTGLADGITHHIAVQAKNTSGTESVLSDPVTAVPHLVLGVKSPDRIGDLRLAKSGADAVLSWSPVTLNIYDQPTTISKYEVYRGDTVQFVPSLANLLDPQPTGASFTDLGALSGGEPHFYLVRAVDGAGNPGGLGGQLPGGIGDLSIGASSTTPGAIVLSWTPVTEDFDGGTTVITHHYLYADDDPFDRGAIRDGAVSRLGGPIVGSSVEIVPAGPERYYSVLAVDVRGNLSPF
jgi:hypothetical protein